MSTYYTIHVHVDSSTPISAEFKDTRPDAYGDGMGDLPPIGILTIDRLCLFIPPDQMQRVYNAVREMMGIDAKEEGQEQGDGAKDEEDATV